MLLLPTPSKLTLELHLELELEELEGLEVLEVGKPGGAGGIGVLVGPGGANCFRFTGKTMKPHLRNDS